MLEQKLTSVRIYLLWEYLWSRLCLRLLTFMKYKCHFPYQHQKFFYISKAQPNTFCNRQVPKQNKSQIGKNLPGGQFIRDFLSSFAVTFCTHSSIMNFNAAVSPLGIFDARRPNGGWCLSQLKKIKLLWINWKQKPKVI